MPKLDARLSRRGLLPLGLLPLGLAAALAAGCGGGDGGATAVTTPPPAAVPRAFVSGQSASTVIGQADFTGTTANQGGAASASTLNSPNQLALASDGRLFVADVANHRALVYGAIPASANAAATLAVGQGNLTDTFNPAPPTSSSLSTASGVAVSGTRMAVVDTSNHRVLLFNTIPTVSGAPADLVLGQGTQTSNAPGCHEKMLRGPNAVAITPDGKIIVSDAGNHRVMIWNAWPVINGPRADVVLGQQSLFTCQPNDADGNGATDAASAATLASPASVWSDGTRLLVADTANSRVLAWDQLPAAGAHGTPADRVLGQVGMTTTAANDTDGDDITDMASAATLNQPRGVHSDGTRIVVADWLNHRVLVWNTWPAPDGAAADLVLGQPNFTATTAGSGSAQFNRPSAALISGDDLLVSDRLNHRVLVFKAQ
mgnify:FL=1